MNPPAVTLKLSTWNARGVMNKYHELLLFMNTYDLDIVLLTETKLASHKKLVIPNYKVYRADHPSNSSQGGSAVIVKANLQHDELLPIIEENMQVARIVITIRNHRYQIGSFYSAPRNRMDQADFLGLFHEMSNHFILGGDFNSKHRRWGSNLSNPRGMALNDIVHRLSLEPIFPIQPTYYPDNSRHTPDVLDFFISKHASDLCSAPSVLDELSSDHHPVVIELSDSPPKIQVGSLIKQPFDWKAYTDTINELTDLQIPLKTPQDVDKAVTRLTRNIQTAASLSSSTGIRTNMRKNSGTSQRVQQLLTIKRACKRRWKNTRYPPHKIAYNRATRELKQVLKEEYNAASISELSSLDPCDGSLYRKTRYLTKETNGIPPLRDGAAFCCTSTEKSLLFSNILYEQFTPNPAVDADFEAEILNRLEEPLQLSPFYTHFTPGQVRNAISRSPTKKAPGYDLITQPLLKALPRKTIVFLTQIFNAMLRLGYFPTSWKFAIITMIHKPGKERTDPTAYRPISLLSLFSKIFERLLLPILLRPIEPLLPDTQFGFRASHSCVQQLHRVVDTILDAFENKEVCHGVFLDTEKAFDRVWIQGLLVKLKPVLTDSIFRLMHSYLNNRTFAVRINESISPVRDIKAGVPQGSVLGPILYAFFVHDLPSSPTLTVAQFADDQAILSSGTDRESLAELQNYVDQLGSWCCLWRTKLNPQKSTLMQFTYKRKTISPHLRVIDETISHQPVVRYLGLQLDTKLTWDTHISTILQRSRHRFRQLYFLLNSKSAVPLTLKRLIYLTIIRPIWLYGCQIWGSASNSQIKRIQTFQNRVLRTISGAPWYIRNSLLHRDLQIPEVTEVLSATYRKLENAMRDHPNNLIAHISNNPPPPRPERRLKRKRPPDLL